MNGLLIFSESLNSKEKFKEKYENIIFIQDKKAFSKLKKCKEINLFFDFENLNLNKKNTSKYIKKIKKIGNFISNNKIRFDIINKLEIEKTKNEFECFLLISAECIKIENKKDRVEFLYDKICEFLDYQFSSKNLCDFKNNMCFAKRKYGKEMGCCHHYKNAISGIIFEKNLELCEFQKDKSCKAKCITCKMFVCDEIAKKGIKFTNNNVLIIKYYFNIIQKIIIRTSFFKKREDILKKLIFFTY